MKLDTLIASRWIIPVSPPGLVLEHHALGVSAGKLVDIGPQSEMKRRYQADEVIQLDRHALIPGLINAHTHSAMAYLRGYADDRPLMEWLQHYIWPLERQWVGEAFVRDGSQLAIAEMLRGGVTCFNDMYFFPEVTAERAAQSGIRACIGLILVDFPSAWADNADDYLDKGLALHRALAAENTIHTAFAPHAPYTVSDQALQRLSRLASDLDVPVHMHLHETRGEIEQSLKCYGMRPLQRLQQLDLLGPSLIAVHMTQLMDAEIHSLAECGASVVHCPESNLKLASGFCPVAQLLGSGVNVALGTDSAASNNDLDMLGEMRTAALVAKGVAQDATAVSAPVALSMATINGAEALGLADQTGSLAVGKSADVTAIRLDTLETQPLFDPISQIVYAANRDQVTDVWVAGRRLLKSRTLTTLDEADIQDSIASWADKLMKTRQED